MRDPLLTPDRIAFAGDWHMNADWAEDAIAYAISEGADVIVHLGDFGFTFDDDFLRRVGAALREDDTPLLFVDGNHEKFDSLYRMPLDPRGLRRARDRIWHLPRGFRWTWDDIRFLALGGAHSVDRNVRTPYVDWWPEETISAFQARRAMEGGRADVLICHDCPAGVDIPGLQPYWFHPDEIARADRHRELMRHIVDEVRPRRIFHGHYHVAYDATADLGYGPVQVTGLDCDATALQLNVRMVNLADLAAAA